MPVQFDVSEVNVKAERRRRTLKALSAAVICAGVVAAGIGLNWYFTPPAMPESLDEARELVDSPRFTRLSDDQKRPYYDVIREQYGSLDRDERRRMMDEDEKLRQTMREAGSVMMRDMLVNAARGDGTPAFPGRPSGGPPGENNGERPERTPEQQAERAQRLRDHISDRMANGDSQMNQMMREMFAERRAQNNN